MNSSSTITMQQEAAERVRRMQEHSRRLVSEHPVNVYRGVTFEPSDGGETKMPDNSANDTDNLLSALLQGDGEQTLVLLLAVILAKNGAPLELVLALLYIAM